MLFENGSYEEHVGTVLVRPHLKIISHSLLKHAGGEWAEHLAEFDLPVHRRLHVAVARVTDDAASPQRTRAELHAAVEPAYDLAFRQDLSDGLEQLGLVCATLMRSIHLSEEIGDEIVGVLRAEEAAFLGIMAVGPARFVEQLMPDEASRAEGSARIAGRRLNPDVLEQALAKQAAIGDAVESDTARQHEVLHFGLAMNLSRHAEHDFFGDLLDAGRDVHVAL